MGTNPPSRLEETVKSLLRQRALSMRQLALLTGINVATISKMLAGKQRVNPDYLQKMARHLSVQPVELFKAAGFDIDTHESPKQQDASVHHIQEILQHVGFEFHQLNRQSIEQELMKYESYAKTNEGHELIVAKFPDKRKQIPGFGPFVDDLDEMYTRYLQVEISEEERTIIGSGLLYFVLATDAIPDFVFPIGYLDDALAIQITRDRLSNLPSKG